MSAVVAAAGTHWDRDALLRETAIGAIGGGLAGMLVGGIGGRIAMRIAGAMTDAGAGLLRTDNGNVLGEITFGGTVALILFVGLFPGVVAGVMYVAALPWLSRFGRAAGAVFGFALLAAVGSSVIEPFNIDFRKFGSPPVNVAMFALLFPLYGAALGTLEAMVRGRVAHARGPGRDALLWVSAAGAALFYGAILLSLGDAFGDRRDPRPYLPFYVIGAALAMRARGRVPTAIAYAVLLLPAAIGVPATVDAILFAAR